MKKLGVFFGGESSEYGVSLHSAASFIRAVDLNEYLLTMIGIKQDGTWLHYTGSVEQIDNDTWHLANVKPVEVRFGANGGLFVDNEKLAIDVAFPILHGKNGEDGTIQGVFEMMHLPYVGSGVLSTAMCLDKEMTHILCEKIGIEMAKYQMIRKQDDVQKRIDEIDATMKYPLFVKPSNVGSSYGISKVRTKQELVTAVALAFEYDTKMLVEEGIVGFEIGCAVLGNEQLFMGEIDQVDTKNDFFDYEGKYDLVNTEIYCPAHISPELKAQAKQNAEKIYRVMECSGLARVDMFVTEQNTLVFNEINTLPGFTSTSRYPTMMAKAQLSYPNLIAKLYDLALEKHG